MCSVCDNVLTAVDFKKITPTCVHLDDICNKCTHDHIMNIVKGGSYAVKNSYAKIACPSHNCESNLEGKEISAFLSRAEFEHWDALVLQEWYEVQPEFRWCSSVSCGSGQLVDGGEAENSFF